MKKTLIFLIVLLPSFLWAQRYPTGKGTFRSGGGTSMDFTKEDGYNEYKFTITPRLGYFVTDEILLGFSSNYTMVFDTAFTSAIKFSPEFKYYYPLSKSTFLIGDVKLGIDRSTTFTANKSIDDHTSVSAGPGMAYFFSRKVGFEVDILYQQYINPDATHQSKVAMDGGVVFNILSYKERKKENRKKHYELDEDDDE